MNHEWYNLFGDEWDFENMYPPTLKAFFEAMQRKHGEKAEELQAWVAHDMLDKTWDALDLEERREWALVFKTILLDPNFLKEWAGVDVMEGRIKRRLDERYGFREPIEYWEDEPQVKASYQRLKK